jgi:sigma-E factor negative regulatory protein RseB
MRALVVAAALAAGGAVGPAGAQTGALGQASPDAIGWLQRIYIATERLSYTGTFVYQHGERVETSRITRIVDASGVHERLETLDGTPREILRTNEQVTCYLPQTMTMKVERQLDTRPFPAMRADPRVLVEHYTIRKGGTERIAGLDCQSIVLEPKDNLRYGHKLWADVNTGMLVKAKTFNEKREAIEQFAFTQLQVGGRIDREQVKSRFAGKGRDWRVESNDMVAADLARHGWLLKSLPAGYRKVTEMKRNVGASVDVGHIVLSDGLAAVSVFIETLGEKASQAPLGLSRQGAVNVYTRKLDGYLVTVIGEVPAESVKLIAQNVEYRRPQ